MKAPPIAGLFYAVLFYISALERKIIVLADSGINSKIEQEKLNQVVDGIAEGLKKNQFSQGIVNAIANCKELLLENGFNHHADVTNELKNQVISEFE